MQEYHNSTVDFDSVKAVLPFNNEIADSKKRKLTNNYHHEVVLPPGLPTPQPSDSESEDTIADLPLRKRSCSQLNTAEFQLDQVITY